MDVLKRLSPAFAALLFMTAPAAADDTLRLQEQQIKAGLLYNFLKYTEWPADSFARSPSLTVCIFGNDPFDGALTPMHGRTVNRREIAIRHLRDASAVDDCHLLFVSAGEKKSWPHLRKSLTGKSILTVSDFSAFAAGGGMIEFGRRDRHISASLNIDAAAAAGLRVEDRLLRLVTVIHGR